MSLGSFMFSVPSSWGGGYVLCHTTNMQNINPFHLIMLENTLFLIPNNLKSVWIMLIFEMPDKGKIITSEHSLAAHRSLYPQ